MSRHGGVDEDTSRITSPYASERSTGRAQMLPSFRELLPPHLHAEIDSASFQTRSWHYQQNGSSTVRASQTRPRAVPEPSSNPDDGHRALLSRSRGIRDNQNEKRKEDDPFVVYHSEARAPAAAVGSVSRSRASSSALPPIRDLRAPSERNPSWLGTGFDDMVSARPNPFPQEFRGLDTRHLSGRESDKQSSPAFVGSSGPPLLYGQPAYDNTRYTHYPTTYRSDSDYSALVHGSQNSNFGILSDAVDSRGKRRRGNLPKPVTDILRAWFHEHLDHPYPSEEDKQIFMSQTGLSISQISNWFINARRRQLPALRNQIRNEGDRTALPQSPLSDIEQTSSQASCSSPNPSMHS